MANVARRIIIAMDGSKHSDTAFDWYVKYFYKESDSVTLLFCAENGSMLSAPIPSNDPNCIAKLAYQEEDEINKLIKSFQMRLAEAKGIHSGLKCFIQRVSGRKAGEMIVQQAEEQRVDLVIMGSRGRSALRRTFAGSVSQYVVHHARIPTLVVRTDTDTAGSF